MGKKKTPGLGASIRAMQKYRNEQAMKVGRPLGASHADESTSFNHGDRPNRYTNSMMF